MSASFGMIEEMDNSHCHETAARSFLQLIFDLLNIVDVKVCYPQRVNAKLL